MFLLVLSSAFTVTSESYANCSSAAAGINNSTSDDVIQKLRTFQFQSTNTALLSGKSSESGAAFGCTGEIRDSDVVGCLVLVSQLYSNGCYTDGRYNHNNYQVEAGYLQPLNGTARYDAYRIHEPQHKASEFLGSQHIIHYKFPSKEDYSLFRLIDNSIEKIREIPAAMISVDGYTKIDGLSVSEISGSTTYIFTPSNAALSDFNFFGNGIEAAQVGTTILGNLSKYRFKVGATPFDLRTDFDFGPDSWENRYSYTRQFFFVEKSNGEIGVLWQDRESSDIKLTWLNSDFSQQQTLTLPNHASENLVAATYDLVGNIYYLQIQGGDGSNNDLVRSATFYKVDSEGQNISSHVLDSSKSGLNMVKFDHYPATLVYNNNSLLLLLARQMTQSNDGLNHQGGIAVSFNPDTLRVEKNWGQTSGHSFDNYLTKDGNDFIAIDLGDNYPRGIHLHKFSGFNQTSRVIYNFKTKHGTTPKNPAGITYPIYNEITDSITTYYRWSNDNRTYTELGGIISSGNGYSVLFIGEPNVKGLALNNQQVDGNLVDARNIGLLLIRRDFENASGGGSVVSNDLVLSNGLIESGGFYTFNGTWKEQRNSGVVWLTNYQDPALENASRLKVVELSDNSLLLLWEKWSSNSYIASYAMQVSSNGDMITPAFELSKHIRLNRRDDPFIRGNQLFLINGEKNTPALELIKWDLAPKGVVVLEIDNIPALSVMSESSYSYVPTVNNSNNSPVTFTVDGLPSWADFDPEIGMISGTPSKVDVGYYGNIQITINDGNIVSQGDPFGITVMPKVTISNVKPSTTSSGGGSGALDGIIILFLLGVWVLDNFQYRK